MTLYTHAESNIRKTWLYLTFFLLLIVAVGWTISYFLESPLILWASLVFAFLANFFSYWYSDKIVLTLSRARPIKKEDNPELYRIVENLCITAGLPMPRIYIIQEPQPNAFATGRNPKHAALAVTQGLLEKLERTELEGVIAHELSHIGNKDILLATIVVVLVGMVITMIDFFYRISRWGSFSRKGGRGGDKAKAVMMLVALALIILAPLFAMLLKSAISRKREFLADASGALLTRYPEGLAKALEKISQDNNPLRTANDATAHLYIASPFRGKELQSRFHKLFSTHPPVEERIKALRDLKV